MILTTSPQQFTCALLVTFFTSILTCQVGIGTTSPHPSSMLEIGDGTDTAGLLVPRVQLSSAAVAAPVVNPANSLLVYNTATDLSHAGYINDVRPGFYSWDSASNRWVTQTKETRTAKWKSTNTTELLNDNTATRVNLFGTEVYNDDPSLFVVTPSNTEDELLIAEDGRYEVTIMVGIEVDEDDVDNEIVIRSNISVWDGTTETFPSVATYTYINDDDNMYRSAMQVHDIIEIKANSYLYYYARREVDYGEVRIDGVGAAVITVRKLR